MSTESRPANLKTFVDRKQDLKVFLSFLENPETHVFYCYGDTGVGKSFFSKLLQWECTVEGIRPVCVDFKDPSIRNYSDLLMAIARKVSQRKDRPTHEMFPNLSQTITEIKDRKTKIDLSFDGNLNVDVGRELQVGERGRVGDMVGIQVVANDSNSGRISLDSDSVWRITDAFQIDWKKSLAKEENIIFFDHFEKIGDDDRILIHNTFFEMFANDETIQTPKFFISSRPQANLLEECPLNAIQRDLNDVAEAEIKDYLRIHKVDESLLEGIAFMVYQNTNGRMANVADQVGALVGKLHERKNN